MDTFHWVAVVVSMILGLAVARILLASVSVFRARRHVVFDAVPLMWAGIIFLQQVNFWWSLQEVSLIVKVWTLGIFALFVALVLCLFLAAALILPSADAEPAQNLRTNFAEDGRYALLPLAAFNGLALTADLAVWGSPIASIASLANLVVAILPIAAFAAPRPAQLPLAIGYLVVMLAGFALLTPLSY